MNADIKFEIINDIATLSGKNAISKKIRLVSFGEKSPKIDIRTWKASEAGEIPYKGVSLNTEEALALRDALVEYFAAS